MANDHRCKAMAQLMAGKIINYVQIYQSARTERWYMGLRTRYDALDVPISNHCPFCDVDLDKGKDE